MTDLYLAAALAHLSGHSNVAIALAVAATIAVGIVLEIDDLAALEEAHRISVERLALVLVYARAQRNPTGDPGGLWWLNRCRRLAVGLDRW